MKCFWHFKLRKPITELKNSKLVWLDRNIPPVCLRVYNGKGAEREEMLPFLCLDVKENKKEWKGEKHVISLPFIHAFIELEWKCYFLSINEGSAALTQK